MYNAHYQFRESPFGVTPDPQFYYSNAVYREAWAALRYGIEGRKGFILIAGEAGTGKTTLLRKALHEFPSNIKAAYIPNSLVSFNDLLRLVLKDLGLPHSTDDKFDLMERLNHYLLEQFNSANTVALLIDEAQDLSVECLEELRLLGNLETDKHKLLQIVLVGQPGLERKLSRPELLQLKQRVVLHCRLRPVESGEVGAYIESRLRAIDRRSADLFEADAIQKIAVYSKGFPRLINIICDNALLTAYALSQFKVTGTMVDEVADDLRVGESRFELPSPEEPLSIQFDDRSTDAHRDGTRSRSASRSRRPMIGTVAAIAMLTALGGLLYSQRTSFFAFNPSSDVAAAIDHGQVKRAQLVAHALAPKLLVITPPQAQPASRTEAAFVSDPSASTVRLAATGNIPPAPKKIAATAPITPDKEQPSRAAKRKQASSSGRFFVAGASFVRSKPTPNAEIIATLEPGTRIAVAGRTGAYFRVRSLGTERVRGYVHEEDAFFERP